MRPEALHRLADELAGLGYNTLIVEWEASFPYRRHATIAHERAYRPEEIRSFLAVCRDLGLTVIPLQQTLGHLKHVLRHARYAELREDRKDRCQLCPRKIEAARTLVRELLLDLREFHDGPWVHLGGDEAYLLGHCPACHEYAREHGLSRLYAECMVAMIEEAKALGWRPLIWADMLLKHPECVELLPRDTVLIDWNYGWAPDRFGPPEALLRAGFTVWGAAALRSAPDNHSLTFWGRHLRNLRDFLPWARTAGYDGMVLTSWSTSGVFGYEWDEEPGGRVLNLRPVRRVYPLNGHRLLMEAFIEALDPERVFDPEEFLVGYARRRFGVGAGEGVALAKALGGQTPGYDAGGSGLEDSRPAWNREEFAHLRLIAALHRLWGDFLRVEAVYQSADYSRAAAVELAGRTAGLAARSRVLEAEYATLQAGYLMPEEIAADSEVRSRALLELHARVARQAEG